MIQFLSVRTRNLNIQDNDGMTILMHNVLAGNYSLCSKLIYRGAKIDIVNMEGKSALHICVEKRLNEAVEYLLYKGANPHILDLNEQDCCDKAKHNGLQYQVNALNVCSINKKLVPLMPDGTYPSFNHNYKKQVNKSIEKKHSIKEGELFN